MMKKLLSLCAAALLVLPAPVLAVSAADAPGAQNGVYTYLTDDFEDYNEGLICSATADQATILSGLVKNLEGKSISDIWNFQNNKHPKSTFSLEKVKDRNGNDAKAVKMSVYEKSTGVKFSPKITQSKGEQYYVLKAWIKNGSSTDDAFNYMRFHTGVRISKTQVMGTATGSPSSAYGHPYGWNEFMFVVDTNTGVMDVVINNRITGIKVSNDNYKNFSYACSLGFDECYDTERAKNAWFDSVDVYGVNPNENKLTYTKAAPKSSADKLVLEFSNPVTLTQENISLSGGAAVTDVSFENGKYYVSLSGLEPMMEYTVNLNGVQDVFGHALSEGFTFTTEAAPRIPYAAEDFEDGSFDAEKFVANNAASTQGDTYTWSVVDTVKNDGSATKALKLNIHRKADTGNAAYASGANFKLKNSVKSNQYFVYKANMRFGEADGSNFVNQVVFCGVALKNDGSATYNGKNYPNLFERGKWFDVMVTIYLDPDAPANNTAYPSKAYLSINGKYVGEGSHNLFNGQVADGRAVFNGIYPNNNLADCNLYIDDIDIYTIAEEQPAASEALATDRGLSFRTEHPLTDLDASKITATVNGQPAEVEVVSAVNGVYSVVLSKAVKAGDEISVTVNNVTDMAGNTLTSQQLSATAGEAGAVKVAKNTVGGLTFLSVNSTYAAKPGLLFIASYDGDRLSAISVQEVELNPGLNYYKAAVGDGVVKAILVDSYDSLRPLLKQ